mgnify:CR=1 FL=1
MRIAVLTIDILPLSRYNRRMDNIINNYWVNNDIEVLVCDDDGKRVFVVVNTDSGMEEEISERAALLLCTTPDSTIRAGNWEDFCTARGFFLQDH